MTDCDRLRADSAALSSLPPGYAERETAFAHAASCPGCAAALREGALLLALIDAGLPAASPSAASLSRVRATLLASLDRDEAVAIAAPLWQPGLGLLVLALFPLLALLSGHRAVDPPSLCAAALAALFAGTAASVARAGAWTAAAAGVGAVVFAAWAGTSGGLDPLLGLKCLALELGAAAVPFAAAALSRNTLARPSSAGPAAAVAAAAALAGQAALHLTCRASHELPHLLLFHVAGVGLAACLGARFLVARRPGLS